MIEDLSGGQEKFQSGCGRIPTSQVGSRFVLYQGTTSVGPYRMEKELGFSPLHLPTQSGKEKARGL